MEIHKNKKPLNKLMYKGSYLRRVVFSYTNINILLYYTNFISQVTFVQYNINYLFLYKLII